MNIINSSLLWLAPPSGGWRKVCLQVCVQPRGAVLHGFPRQPKAEPEGRPGRPPTDQWGGWPPSAQPRGGGSLPGRRRGAVHPGTGFPWQLPVLDSTAWQLEWTWDILNSRNLKLLSSVWDVQNVHPHYVCNRKVLLTKSWFYLNLWDC